MRRHPLAFLSLAFALPAQSLAQAPVSPPPQIVTTGVGEALAVPDRATITVSVQTRSTTASSASADNGRRVKAVLDTLRSLGVLSDALETVNYSVSPEMQYTPNQPPHVTGYVITNSVAVRLKRVDDVGRVIDASLAKGANEISTLQFASSQADSVRSVALSAAVVDARSQAEAMARAAGGSLGQLIELSAASVPTRPIPLVQSFAMRAGSTPISPGDQAVSATVTARWAFVPGR
jgi:uncharacterized protein